MSDVYEIPRGDLEPPFEPRLLQPATAGDADAFTLDDGSWVKPVNLTSAERVWLIVRPVTGDGPRLRREATFLDRAAGKLRLAWQPGDTDIAGGYLVQAEIRWAGDRPQTVPSRGRGFPLRITPDAG